MIWLTWRQFRVQAIAAAAVLAAVAILLGTTGPHLAGLYAASGITGCSGDGCANAAGAFLNQLTTDGLYHVGYPIGFVVIFVAPAMLGIFWGAPLIARELETGTYRLAWSQSVTRTRWLAVKLALTGLAAMAVTEALALMHAWWADPISKAIALGGGTSVFSGSRFSYATFATNGITPLGYAAFAFALGTAGGALFRRTLPAMAVTLAIFAAVQVAVPLWIRPHLIPAQHTTVSVASLDSLRPQTFSGEPGAWLLSSKTINAAGQPVTVAPDACLSSQGSGKDVSEAPYLDCLASQGVRETITYQPASRYWAFQWIETGIFLALAFALAGVCFWRLGRRRA